MKTLSIIQPWATLIATGEKRIETRSWATKYRGPLLIHSSKKIEKFICDKEPFYSTLHSNGIDSFEKLPIGAIIARCNLVDCLKIIDWELGDNLRIIGATLENDQKVSGNEVEFGNYCLERYAWILEDVEILKEPIPAKGKLNLWNFRGEIET
ncbi:ASCH domain-containing protein [Anaerosolibacter sp.]|uniref:ASCH domain-containing protein n=1 Tax=Anaerosolibacter sp. TaxID=1872527 RepID=UPI00260BE280|nr:ASCH domain-containing protein [Anaerosolibacter sp.]